MATSQQDYARGSLSDAQPVSHTGWRRYSVRSGWALRALTWLPGALTVGFTAAVLNHYGVPVSDLAFYGAYLVLCLALPGLLLIRALYGRTRTLTEEVALGLALGLAVEVAAYIAARAAGAPLLVLAWPIATFVIFLLVPRLRTHWKAGPRPVAPVWWSWALALIVCYLTAKSAYSRFSIAPLTWPALAKYSDDMPFHLGLIGELKHHMPPMSPTVAGEPLFYHWFVYAHWAAASWITGVEPLVLLVRLGVLPMLAAFVVLVAMLARRVMNSWKGAVLAVIATLGLGAPRLFLGPVGTFTWGGIHDAAWGSPTFTFGSLLFVPVVYLVIDLLGQRRYDLRVWILLGVFLMAVMGAKATYLPMLVVGLVTAAVVGLRRRRRPWPVLAALVMAGACLLFAQFVLFGRQQQGLTVAPLSYMGSVWQDLAGMSVEIRPPLTSLLGVAAVYLLAWAVTWSPVLGLLSRPRLLIRSDVLVMLGIAAAGLGVMVMFDHPGRSQSFFLWGSYPYLAIVAVFGALVIVQRARVPRRTTLCAIGVGLVGAYAIVFLCGVRAPLAPGQPDSVLYLPYIALAVAIGVGGAIVVATRSGLRGWALVISALAVIGLPAAHHVRVLSFLSRGGAESSSASGVPESAIPQGVLSAARWVRAHSTPDDLVATNVHCRWGSENPCESNQFWLSALTERRMLVEGWAFTAKSMDLWTPGHVEQHQPFWDPERLKANDAVFLSPSPATIQRLRDRYGVRLLLVDERRLPRDSRLGEFAELQYRAGDIAAYRLPAASDHVPQSGV
ncbi:hypothetical protein ABZ297_19110 [Nonomuraea sp. NPDC005983]|uniref:hypothetical protein n=1 Tax=Nonomuraea sp. NPDC005983 TaxID=3155595 RepID=UPI0033A3D24C